MGHGRYAFSPIDHRPPLKWPDGARIAVWVILNVEHFEYDKPGISIYPMPGLSPDVLNHAWRDYGNRVGFWRLLRTLEKHGLRASVALNSAVCDHYPALVEEARKRDWEFLGHGRTNSQLLAGLSEEQERELIGSVVQTIAEQTGTPPRGWLSPALTETPRTLDLLAEAGIDYVCDWCNDDQPYPLEVAHGSLLSVPYSIEVNDIPLFLSQGQSGEIFYQTVCDQFDVLYEEGKESGRVMAIALHPFITGLPFRAKHLDRALAYIRSHRDVWFTTGGEIAGWYRQNGLELQYTDALRPIL